MASERPQARVDERVARAADDNTVPEMAAVERQAIARMLRAGVRRLLRGAPPARARLSRPVPSPWLSWLPVLAAPSLVVGLVAVLLPGWPTAVAGIVGGGLTLLLVLVAAGIDSTVPPPRRPDCQHEQLDGRPHPLLPYFARTGLVEYVPGQVWVAQVPLRFHGMQLATRMTIVRTGPDELLVCSPIALDDELRAQVEALGQVRHVVAPNTIHHLYVGQWLEAFPRARAYAAPGLPARRPDLPWAATIDEQWDPPWRRELVDLAVLRGHSFWIEVVLLHRPSKTLVVADALESFGFAPETGGAMRFLLELIGMAERPAPPVDLKVTFDDLAATRRGVETILGWDFERIVLAHGRLVEREAKQTFADAWAFAYDE